MHERTDHLDSETLRGLSQQGDSAAIAALLDRHMDDLRAFVRLNIPSTLRQRESVSDIVQSVCCEILTTPERLDYRGEGAFRNWLYGAVLHKIRDHDRYFRRAKRDMRKERQLDTPSCAALLKSYAGLGTPSRHAMSREALARIESAFDRLPAEQREIVLLAKIVRLPQPEIAEEMGISIGAVRSRLSRSLARLAILIDQTPG